MQSRWQRRCVKPIYSQRNERRICRLFSRSCPLRAEPKLGSSSCATGFAQRSRRSRTNTPSDTPAEEAAGRFERTQWQRARRWRRDDLDHARAGVRESRGQHIDRVWRVRARISQRYPGRFGRSAILGERDLARRSYALAAGPGGAHEHPSHHHRRKAGSAAVPTLPRFIPTRRRSRNSTLLSPALVRPTTARAIAASKHGATNTFLSSTGESRAAPAGSFLTISTAATGSATSRFFARSATLFLPCTRRSCGPECGFLGRPSNVATSSSAAAATSSSISSTTAERYSA